MNFPGTPRAVPSFWIYFLIWLTASACGIYFRLFPLTHYVSFDAQEKASVFVLANLRQNIIKSVETGLPQLSPAQRQHVINQQFGKTLHADSQEARQTIERVAKEIDRTFPPKVSIPYLLEADPYNYFSLTEKILAEGTIGLIRGSKFLNPMMLAPEGHWEPLNLHPFVGAAFDRLVHLFNPDLPLRFSLSFVPLIFAALSLIPFLIITRQLGVSTLSAAAASIVFILAPIFLKRSLFAWYDNDPYNVFFPLCILSLIFAGAANKDNRKRCLAYGLACAAAFSLYALFWHGWMYLLTIILGGGGLMLLYNGWVLKDRAGTFNLFLLFLLLPVGTLAGIGLIFGGKEFFVLFQEGLKALTDFLNPTLSIWPDLYIAVGELRHSAPSFLVDQTGGMVVSVLAGVGLIVETAKLVTRRKTARLPVFVLILFFFSALALSLGAQRFVILYLLPLVLFFLLGLDFLFHSISEVAVYGEHRFLRLGLNLLIPVAAAALTVMPFLDVPKRFPAIMSLIYNDVWDNSLTAVEAGTPEDAIVNTWWPPGHFIKATAKRRVTFDGATINTPQAYWMASVFLSDDEQKALGILRMLNTSANQATEFLMANRMPASKAIALIRSITALDRAEAERALQGVLSEGQVRHLLELTHGTPPPSYLLIYNELVEKNIQLSFIRNWDFEEVERINADPARRGNIPPRKSPEHIRFLWNLAGGQPKYSETLYQQAREGSFLTLSEHVRINLDDMTCRIESKRFGKGRPLSVIYFSDGEVKEKPQSNANLNYSVLLFQEDGTYKGILLDRQLGRSLLMRLYFFGEKGLKYVTPFHQEKDLTGRTQILIYKIEWEKFLDGRPQRF